MPVHNPLPHDRPSRRRPKAAGPLPGDRPGFHTHLPDGRRIREPHQVNGLAQDMRDLVASTGAATEEDLLRMGWSKERLDACLADARSLLGPAGEVAHG